MNWTAGCWWRVALLNCLYTRATEVCFNFCSWNNTNLMYFSVCCLSLVCRLLFGAVAPQRFRRAPLASTFFGSTNTVSRFGELFRRDQYSLVSFLFAVLSLTAPPVPSHYMFVLNTVCCDVISCRVWSCDTGQISVYDKIVIENNKKRKCGNVYINLHLKDGSGMEFTAC